MASNGSMMKAVIYNKYGTADVLHLQEVEKPTPKNDQVLVKIHAATVTKGDCELRSFNFSIKWFWLPLRLFMGLFKPRIKILGQEIAGEIEAVGKDVHQFQVGDKVFGPAGMNMGGYAEYKCLSAKHPLVSKADNLSYEEVATIPTGGINGLHFIRKANIQPGQTVLINGAGGSIGTYGLQLAKMHGAEVTCVDAANKLDMLCEIGADHVIDYAQEDYRNNGKTYDVIFDIVGNGSFSGTMSSLNQNGYFLVGNPRFMDMIRAMWISLITKLGLRKPGKKVIFEFASEKMEDLTYLNELMSEGKIKAIIDKRYPLEQLAQAHQYVDDNYKAGNVVITI